jgi:hypothetical protein
MASEFNSGGVLKRRFRMIISETPNRLNSRWLQASVLLCAIVVLPLGVGYAQDYEAVGKRLKAAVEAGELTGEQAKVMLGSLRKSGGTKKDQNSDKVKAYLAKVKKELGAAIDSGKISEEDAAKKYEAAEKAIKKGAAAGRSQTQAKESQKADAAHKYLTKVRKELGVALKKGEISKEDAAKRYEVAARAIQERTAAGRSEQGSDRITREDLSRAGIEIRKAVAAGKLSEKEGRAKMDAMRKMVVQQIDGAAKRGVAAKKGAAAKKSAATKKSAAAKKDATKKITREDFARAEIEIRKAVVAGKLSEEDAKAKLAAMRKMIGEKSKGAAKNGTDWESIKRRIESAVKSGDMTREEADAKYKEIRERMAGRRER